MIYSNGDILNDRYRILEVIGEGTYSKVIKAQDLHKNNEEIAMKIMKHYDCYRNAAKSEINILEKLAKYDSHNEYNFIQMKDWFDYDGHICIALELLGPNVHEFMINNNYKPYSIEEVKQITHQVIRMANFMHNKKVRKNYLKNSRKNYFVFFLSEKEKIYVKIVRIGLFQHIWKWNILEKSPIMAKTFTFRS